MQQVVSVQRFGTVLGSEARRGGQEAQGRSNAGSRMDWLAADKHMQESRMAVNDSNGAHGFVKWGKTWEINP